MRFTIGYQVAFKSGAEWNGNRFGAPKKEFRRDALTEKMVMERQDDISEVTDKLFDSAKNGEPWAIKLVCQYAYTLPKSRDEAENETQAALVSQLVEIPRETLIEVQKLLTAKMKESNS
jgi:hypothetical protein